MFQGGVIYFRWGSDMFWGDQICFGGDDIFQRGSEIAKGIP